MKSVCVGLLYFVLRACDNKWTHSSSSSWRGRSRGAAAEEDAEEDTVEEQQLKRMQSGSSSWRGHSRGAAAEEDTVGEQQLKRTQSGEQQLKRTQSGSSSWRRRSWGAAAEENTVGEQHLKWTQLGHSSVWPRKTSARQRDYRTRRVRVGGCARLVQFLRLMHHEELQVSDCLRRQMKGHDQGEVTSEQATCRRYYSCCTVLLLFYTLQICYVRIV